MKSQISASIPLNVCFMQINRDDALPDLWWPYAIFDNYGHLAHWHSNAKPRSVFLPPISRMWYSAVFDDQNKGNQVFAIKLGYTLLSHDTIIFSNDFGERKSIALGLGEHINDHMKIPDWANAVEIATELEYNEFEARQAMDTSDASMDQTYPVSDDTSVPVPDPTKKASTKAVSKKYSKKVHLDCIAAVIKTEDGVANSSENNASSKAKAPKNTLQKNHPKKGAGKVPAKKAVAAPKVFTKYRHSSKVAQAPSTPSIHQTIVNVKVKRESPRVKKNQSVLAKSSPAKSQRLDDDQIAIGKFDAVFALLRKAGYRCIGNKYCNPFVSKPNLPKYVEGRDYFSDISAFRKHLCAYGVHCIGTEKWSDHDKKQIDSWVRYSIVAALRGMTEFKKCTPLLFGEVHKLLLKLGFKYQSPHYFEPGCKPKKVDGLCINGGWKKDGEDGLWARIARFGLSSSCEFSNLSADERMKLELYLCDCPFIDTFARLEPKEDDPVQSVTSTAVSSADDTESTSSTGQNSEVRDVEDVVMPRFPCSGKSVASATIVSKSTICSSPGVRSAASCAVMPASQVHPSEDIFMPVNNSCEPAVFHNDETVAASSAHKTTNVKAHMMPAETPKAAPGSACKNLFENVASVMKHEVHGEENVSFARKDIENGAEQKVADESLDMHLDRPVTPSSSNKKPEEVTVTTDAIASVLVHENDTESVESSRGKASPDSPTMMLEIEENFGPGFVLGSEQDSPNSAAVAEELGADSCIGSTRKSISFGPFDDSMPSINPTGSSEGSSCSVINNDSPFKDVEPLKTQPDFASDGEFMSDDEKEKVEDTKTTASSPVVLACTRRPSISNIRRSPRISPMKSVEGEDTRTAASSPVVLSCIRRSSISNMRRSPIISPMKYVLELATETCNSSNLTSKSTSHATPNKATQDWISLIRPAIQPNDEWRTVMSILREEGGLSFQKGNNLVAYYWIFPWGKSQREGGVLGVDYLHDEDALKEFAVNHLGWNGGFEYAKSKSRVSRRLLSRELPATCGSPKEHFVQPSVVKSTRKALVSPAEQITKKARTDVGTIIPDENTLPDREEKLGEKLLCCQKVLQVSLEVNKLSSCSSPKFQTQLERVDAFLNAVVDSNGAKCAEAFSGGAMLYVSGAPGVGKTSAVNHACKRLQAAHRNVVFCKISGSQAKSRLSIMRKLANSLNLNFNAPNEKIEDTLKAGRGRGSESRLVIMIIDEIDDILSAASSSKGNKKAKNEGEETLVTLFEWAKKTSLSFALIGISNVVGGPKSKHIRDLGFVGENIVFSTYNKEDLIQIVVDRVGKSIIHEKAIEFAASKVAAGQGDARLMLEFTRSAVRVCLETMAPAQLSLNVMNGPIVTIQHMMKAIKATRCDDYCDIIEALPHNHKIVLCVAVTLSQVSPSWCEIPVSKLHRWTKTVLGHMDTEDDFTVEIFKDCVSALFDQGLLKSDDETNINTAPWTSAVNMTIRLGCQLQDVESALEETLGDNKFYSLVLRRASELDLRND